MSMTDPIADLLTRIRNAHMAKHREVRLPLSKIKLEIVKIMRDEGYITGFEQIEEAPQGSILVHLKYLSSGAPAIRGMERVSRPSRRVYRGKADIPKVLNGLGIVIVTTPTGIMTGRTCRQQGVGGEVLCNIW